MARYARTISMSMLGLPAAAAAVAQADAISCYSRSAAAARDDGDIGSAARTLSTNSLMAMVASVVNCMVIDTFPDGR